MRLENFKDAPAPMIPMFRTPLLYTSLGYHGCASMYHISESREPDHLFLLY